MIRCLSNPASPNEKDTKLRHRLFVVVVTEAIGYVCVCVQGWNKCFPLRSTALPLLKTQQQPTQRAAAAGGSLAKSPPPAHLNERKIMGGVRSLPSPSPFPTRAWADFEANKRQKQSEMSRPTYCTYGQKYSICKNWEQGQSDMQQSSIPVGAVCMHGACGGANLGRIFTTLFRTKIILLVSSFQVYFRKNFLHPPLSRK